MQSPIRLPLNGDRYVPLVLTLQINGFDMTGAVFAAQVRDRKDGGYVRADLGTVTSGSAQGVRLVYAGTDTVAAHIAAGRIDEPPEGYVEGDQLVLSLVSIRISQATMAGMPYAPEIGDDIPLVWDMHITPLGGDRDVWFRGDFNVRAGVTQ